MKFLRLNPKKCNWNMYVQRNAAGEIINFYDYSDRIFDQAGTQVTKEVTRSGWNGETHTYRTSVTAHEEDAALHGIEKHPRNIIFEGAFRPGNLWINSGGATLHMTDLDTGLQQATNADGMEKLFQALAKGIIQVANGAFVGTWTLAKHGNNISVVPYVTNDEDLNPRRQG